MIINILHFTNCRVNRLGIIDHITNICFFTEERCGSQQPFFFYSTPSHLKLGTIQSFDNNNDKEEKQEENQLHEEEKEQEDKIINQKTNSLYRVTQLIQPNICIASCITSKNKSIVTITKTLETYKLSSYNLSTFSHQSSILLSTEITEIIEIYDHPLQEENMIILLVNISENGYFIIFSLKEREILERSRIPCNSKSKFISIFGLLLCCNGIQIIGYSWNSNVSQMNKILQFNFNENNNNKNNIENQNENICDVSIDLSCVSFNFQRVANFIRDGQVLGTQFRLLISNLLEKTNIIDFSLGKGETKLNKIGEIDFPKRKIFSSEFISTSGDEFIVSDHFCHLYFVKCISKQNSSYNVGDEEFDIICYYSYFIGEPISMIKFYPPTQQLLLASVFGSLFLFRSFSFMNDFENNFSLLKDICSALQNVIPWLGDHIEREIEMEFQHYAEQIKLAKEVFISQNSSSVVDDIVSFTSLNLSNSLLPSSKNIIDLNFLNLFESFLSDKQRDLVASATTLSVEEIQTLIRSVLQ